MRIEEIFEWNRETEARSVYGTTDVRHPLIAEMNSLGDLCVSGALWVLEPPRYYDFKDLRLAPIEVRASGATRSCKRRGFPDAQSASSRPRRID